MDTRDAIQWPTLVVLCKRPRPGYGKQRLAAQLGTQAAYRVALALLDSALEDLRDWPGPRVLAPSRPEDAAWAEALNLSAGVLPQPSGNLGQRIQGLEQPLRAAGHEKLIFIGTDAPLLQGLHFRAAARSLEEEDVVLGAADDGGVVLMGSRRPWPDLEPLPWSTAQLGASLRDACLAKGLSLGFVAPGYDIDIATDLKRAQDDLEHDPRPARLALATLLDELEIGAEAATACKRSES